MVVPLADIDTNDAGPLLGPGSKLPVKLLVEGGESDLNGVSFDIEK